VTSVAYGVVAAGVRVGKTNRTGTNICTITAAHGATNERPIATT
jgi:hypothetical protein